MKPGALLLPSPRSAAIAAGLIAAAVLACAPAHADEFQKVRCGADVPKAVIGQRMANARIVVSEAKYRALGLRHLGADEISDRLSSINWEICGTEYILLVTRDGLVRDVLALPAHSRQAPAFSGICRLDGRDFPDIVVAVLDGSAAATPLPAKVAWKIDQKRSKFVTTPADGLRCPREGIYTIDGGP